MPVILCDAPPWFDPRDEGDLARALTLSSQTGAAPPANGPTGQRRADLSEWHRSAIVVA